MDIFRYNENMYFFLSLFLHSLPCVVFNGAWRKQSRVLLPLLPHPPFTPYRRKNEEKEERKNGCNMSDQFSIESIGKCSIFHHHSFSLSQTHTHTTYFSIHTFFLSLWCFFLAIFSFESWDFWEDEEEKNHNPRLSNVPCPCPPPIYFVWIEEKGKGKMQDWKKEVNYVRKSCMLFSAVGNPDQIKE